jgi:hypothetical protein
MCTWGRGAVVADTGHASHGVGLRVSEENALGGAHKLPAASGQTRSGADAILHRESGGLAPGDGWVWCQAPTSTFPLHLVGVVPGTHIHIPLASSMSQGVPWQGGARPYAAGLRGVAGSNPHCELGCAQQLRTHPPAGRARPANDRADRARLQLAHHSIQAIDEEQPPVGGAVAQAAGLVQQALASGAVSEACLGALTGHDLDLACGSSRAPGQQVGRWQRRLQRLVWLAATGL